MLPIAFLTGSPADWIIILVVALIVFGPNKLPEVGRQLGNAMKEFNKLKDELTGAASSLRSEVENVYEPVVRPYTQSHAISSSTVESATKGKVYDQSPEDLMAPVVRPVLPVAEVPSLDAPIVHVPEADDIVHAVPEPPVEATEKGSLL